MIRLLLFVLLSLPAFANPYANKTVGLLDASAYRYTLANSGSLGGSNSVSFSGTNRYRVTVSPIFAPPSLVGTKITSNISSTGSQAVTPVSMAGIVPGIKVVIDTGASIETVTVASITTTTFTANFTLTHTAPFLVDGDIYPACADPCTLTVNRQWGLQYEWREETDAQGFPFNPRKLFGPASAYDSNSCNGIHTFPMVKTAVTTTAPLPMPREVIGQDCYEDEVQLPLINGHASTNLRLWFRIHAPGYNTVGRSDGKFSFRINQGTWYTPTNIDNPSLPVLSTTNWNRTAANGTLRNNFNACAGVKFTTGAYPQTVTALGRWVVSGNSGSHVVRLLTSTGAVLGDVTVNTSGAPVGYRFVNLTTPIRLAANTAYILLSKETNTGDQFYDQGGNYSTTGVASATTYKFSTSATCATENPVTAFSSDAGVASMYGPLNFKTADNYLVPVDEAQYYSRPSIPNASNPGSTSSVNLNQIKPIGGYSQVRDYTFVIPDGTIGASDTTVTISWRFNGSEGDSSGFRILEMAPIEGTDHELTSITFSGLTATATSNGHGLSSGDSVVIRGAPGMRMVSNGFRTLTGAATNTFTFAACGVDTVTPCDGVGVATAPPVNRNPKLYPITDQPRMYATRMLVAKSAFTQTDPSTFTAPVGGDPAIGECLFKFGNETCTAGQVDQLASPVTPYLNYTFHNATCGGANACHSPTGSDLKYYNFSNWVIAQRSYFHGFTLQDGLDIAAYIRGLSISAPTKARPWNPPMQTGPGMSCCTWKKSDTTLTNIVVSSNVATVTVSSAPVIPLKVPDPVTIWGATVDTDLNKTYAITSVPTSTTFTFATSGVANGTYTESTLKATMANNFFAGCGVDCVLTYGNDILPSIAPGGDKSRWLPTSRVEGRDIAYPWQYPDWNKAWLPEIHPADARPNAGYFTSTPYLDYQNLLTCITPGDFTTYKSCGYGTSLFNEFLVYWARGVVDNTAQNLPTHTDQFQLVPDYNAGWAAPSNYGLVRHSIIGANLIAQWTLSVEYQLIGLDSQRMTDLKGPGTATDCYPPWGISNPSFTFNIGTHKVKQNPLSIIDGESATYIYGANIWYVATTAINYGACYDQPDAPIDDAYYDAFLRNIGPLRPMGFATDIISPVLVPQTGNQNPDMYGKGQNAGPGMDWVAIMFREPISLPRRLNYWWYTSAQVTTWMNDYLDMWNSLAAMKTAAYWDDVFLHTQSGAAQTCTGAKASYNNGGQPCDTLALTLTWATLFGADSSKVTTLKNWALTIPSWVATGHNFDNDIAAATQGDAANGATGTLTTPGSNTITFTSCPTTSAGGTMPYVIKSTGGELAELLNPTGGTCTVGNAGTLTFTTIRPHTGTVKAIFGCSATDLEPNYAFGLGEDQPLLWFKCSNMI